MKPIRSPLRWPLGLGSHAWPRRGVARRLAVGTEAMRGDGSITAMSCIALLKDIRLQSIHPYCERIKREQSEELLFKRRHGRQGSQRKSIISTRSYQFKYPQDLFILLLKLP
ncbi:hypothetical protein SORBI_3003G112001 [Sorghum bicolor]|uniref:Uncharacterized protein n=1 Tax=Sorghum bicolor TaxID=4558 RepID=A0A1W0VWX3_SORBI|nr:hypothetical protein SORBI_3003G112001 [Sorghum bicolor]OQU86607.1 hypothetical protein SORBI_3003G112001 [Sorghum bicolor]